MQLLLLGGTIFVGRHLAHAARAAGHAVTIFHRGTHNRGLFAGDTGIETVLGDRMNPGDLARLAADRDWDAVVDTCGYVPRAVNLAADALEPHVRTYCFISSVSVYADWSVPALAENAPLATLADPETEAVTSDTYGGLKVLCENAARARFGDARTLNIRPGYIVGPFDPTDRFTYWVHRAAQGGDILAPETPDATVQFVDARDLAEWAVHLLASGASGDFNADGEPVRFGDLLPACRAAAGLSESEARFVYVSEESLAAQGIEAHRDLPLWTPSSANHGAVIDVSRAVAAVPFAEGDR